MLLTISTTHQPAGDLGYLLHKNPARAQRFNLKFGDAHVLYPESSPERCTAALMVEVDPVRLSRGNRGGAPLAPYVNDRPYAASSHMSVALGEVFGTALGGRSKERPDLVEQELPLEIQLSSVPCRGGEGLLRELFEPLGWEVNAERFPLDPKFPDWGDSAYHRVQLRGRQLLKNTLTHLYVLLPVLDNDKHYWVGEDEVDKLLRHGESWLAAHPKRELITRRYLKHRRRLVDSAIQQLLGEEIVDEPRETIEETINLNQQRLAAVLTELKNSGAKRVLDLGCGEGKLIRQLLKEKQFSEIVGMDVSPRSLEIARERLHVERMSELQLERFRLLHGSLIYRDARLAGFDAAAVVEVIEHLDAPRLAAFERTVFEFARPKTIVLTTPNREYNVKWESLPAGKFRHADHRFEWARAEFQEWANRVAKEHGYAARFLPVGPDDPDVGSPTQMGVFDR
ncbi:MAG: 3' terminal RNA ribose 2'-O-methyltransferase Hen1 [Verrucomicrobiota bacterium]